MVAMGCIALIVLPILGLICGLMLGGLTAGLWGAGIGFVVALAMSGVTALALVKAGRRG